MAEDERPPGADVVDVFVAIYIKQARTATVGEDDWLAADGLECADRAVHPAGHQAARFLEDLARAIVLSSHASHSLP